MVRVVVAMVVEEVVRTNPGDVVHVSLVKLGAGHEQLRSGRTVTIMRKVSDFLRKDRVIDARCIDVHTYLSQVGSTGNRGH
jgi:hypothetical protein